MARTSNQVANGKHAQERLQQCMRRDMKKNKAIAKKTANPHLRMGQEWQRVEGLIDTLTEMSGPSHAPARRGPRSEAEPLCELRLVSQLP